MTNESIDNGLGPNIITFPKRDAESWSTIERILREGLCSWAIPAPGHDAIIGHMKQFYGYVSAENPKNIDIFIPNTVSVADAADLRMEVKNKVESLLTSMWDDWIGKVLLERLFLEAELYKRAFQPLQRMTNEA